MSCHGCARTFGFLTKEYGCTKCGFSCCSKCLVNKTTCKSCSTKSSAAVTPMPPVMLQERLEKLENPNSKPIVVYTDNSRLDNLKRGLSVEDQELVNRLSKLKSEIREIKSVPSQSEIEERLARLKGIDPQVYRKPAVFTKPKSNVDEATDLVNQMKEEVAIDRQSDLEDPSTPMQLDQGEDDVEMLLKREAMAIQNEAQLALEGLAKDKEIQERLKKLKLDRHSRGKKGAEDEALTVDIDSDDEDKQAALIVERALAEDRLELEDEGISAGEAIDEEELPWCELCNEDAQLRCMDCDRDLYCRRCWKETHQERDLKQHRIENYKAPK